MPGKATCVKRFVIWDHKMIECCNKINDFLINLNSKIIVIGQKNDAGKVSDIKSCNRLAPQTKGSNLKNSSGNYMVELYFGVSRLTMFLFKG